MAKTRAFQRPGQGEKIAFNMTPMIDCTFQLIIFFMLTTQLVNEEVAKHVELARPYESQALPVKNVKFNNKVTVNVVSMDPMGKSSDPLAAASAGFYKIRERKFQVGEWERMVDVIKNLKDRAVASGAVKEGDPSREFYLEVRADKRVNWQDVAPVIRAGVEAGVRKMSLTALTNQ
ncbi:MAG: biopolymer transporter ExbD [Planctomycetes bacterium]|nr:biopolymer transporter ExbD [Planctomycetota bacterium]